MHRILRQGHQRGFTLIEIAVVLLILSVILIAAMGVINAQVKKFGFEQTDKHREVVSEYLKMYLRTNRHLPCADSDQDGIENRTGPNPADPCDANAYEGVTPYVTLGLDRDLALDGWDNFFTYRVTPSWTITNTFAIGSGNAGVLDNIDTTGATEESVVVLISHGPNGLGAFNIGGPNAGPTDADEIDNQVGTGHANEYNKRPVTAGSDYDDLVLALESTDLLSPLFADGSIESAEGQALKALRQAEQEVLANTIADRVPVACTPPPATCVGIDWEYTLNGPAGMGAVAVATNFGTDPWGAAFVFTPGAVTTFGPGTTGTQDAYEIRSAGPPGGPPIIVRTSRSAFTGALGAAAGFVAGN